jgi:hypothetical protein
MVVRISPGNRLARNKRSLSQMTHSLSTTDLGCYLERHGMDLVSLSNITEVESSENGTLFASSGLVFSNNQDTANS